jgi:putative ABC transport system permease protein
MLYVDHELSYDLRDKDQVFRITSQHDENGDVKESSAKNYIGLRHILKENFPELTSYTAFSTIPANTGLLFGYRGEIFNELGGSIMADSNFFEVFNSLIIKGNPETALDNPHTMVITEQIANKVFGGTDEVLGKQLDNLEDGGSYIITGVIKDFPDNTQLCFTC